MKIIIILSGENNFIGYNGHCRNLSNEEIEKNLKNNKPYVIRQKMPKDKIITYNDMVYGKIEVNSNILDDQILIKSDGYPTYNFANVVDDHLMEITDIVRGSEYISSTPKYILLYQAFGWEVPNFIHLPLINGKDLETGKISKLSKRHGSVSFEQLIQDGYLAEAIINYISFLGWNPKTDREIFTLDELIENFKISGLHKSAAVFDYIKLNDINHYYISQMSNEDFYNYSLKYLHNLENFINWKEISKLIKEKIIKFSDLYIELKFLVNIDLYLLDDLLIYKKKYIDKKTAIDILKEVKNIILNNKKDNLVLEELFKKIAEKYNVKYGIIIWLIRVALSGKKNTIIGCYEILNYLTNNEIIKRLNYAIIKVQQGLNK